MKTVKLIVVAMFVSNIALSQKVNWGIKAGGNLSSMTDVVEKYPEDKEGYHITQKDGCGESFGFHAGVFAKFKLSKSSNIVNFQPELLFSMQGGKQKQNIGLGGPIWQHLAFKLSYVQLPLLLDFEPIANFGILLGPQLGLNISRKVTATFFDDYWNSIIAAYPDITDKKSVTKSGSDFDDQVFNGKLKKFDAAMVFGIQYTIRRVSIGLRYNLGLVNGNNFPTGYGSATKGWRSNVIQASLGFSL